MTGPSFATLDEIEYGAVQRVAPGIRRVVAENPSKYTYRGTGTFIVGDGEVAVIDPGPNLDSHRGALARALGDEHVVAIAVTHCHADHSPLAAWLHERTGAPRLGHGAHPRPGANDITITDDGDVDDPVDWGFDPDRRVVDGEVGAEGRGWSLIAVHTPGHTSNHVCYAVPALGVLFPGDHVMGWSTTVVSPPDGDMAAYIDSLRKVAARDDATYWPTHGPGIEAPQRFVADLVEHRLRREAGIERCLSEGLATVAEIVADLYADVRPELHRPAGHSVLAHLVKLVDEGRVAVVDAARPALTARFAVRR